MPRAMSERVGCHAPRFVVRALMLLVLAAFPTGRPASAHDGAPDELAAGFANPPNSARPRVWWHWINGNITKDGIASDLSWMARVGIGGVQNFDVGLTQRQVVDQRLVFMTPPWQDAFHFAVETAHQLGLEVAVASSPGWSESGGPWVPAADAMKKLVWSEVEIQGGSHFKGPLPEPPRVTGPYQALALSNQKDTCFGDVAVLAYPAQNMAATPDPHFTSASGQAVDAASLVDDSLETSALVASSAAGEPPTVLISYDIPQTLRSATLFIRNATSMFSEPAVLPRLEVHEGAAWRTLAEMPLTSVPTTVSFAPVTAREFRVVFAANPASHPAHPASQVRIAQLRLSSVSRINQFEVKAGFEIAKSYDLLAEQTRAEERGVSPDTVLDISAHMSPAGVLDWTAPPGRWRVLRLGYSLLGVTNHPAVAEATGLEVDKYDATAVRAYMDHYLELYRAAAGAPALFGSQGLQALVTDSIEAGPSNWTPHLLEQFQRLRGYDPKPWLPTLTGVVVGSQAQSDAFLYDYRKTLADLIASEHYGQMARSAHEAGLKVYGESLEGGAVSLGDDMTMRSHADIPMAALWTFPREQGPPPSALADMRGAASVAHFYGREFVAAESMTSSLNPWAFAPSDLRRIIDLEFANGINRPVIHTSVHQPIDKAPGLSLATFGQYFTRLETWADMAGPWIQYMSRTSYLLQQGRNVADVAYFVGEMDPLTALRGDEPKRYAYDFINTDMLQNALSVEGHEIVSGGGARYRAIYLGTSSRRMTVRVLQRLAQLVEAGAVLIGNAPTVSPSLRDDPKEFDRLVRALWPGGPVSRLGKGQVIVGQQVEAALTDLGLPPDFSYTTSAADSEVLFVHRKLDNGDLYYIDNRKDRGESLEAHFRVSDRLPQVWHADSGTVEPISYRITGGETLIPLQLAPEESCFIVFREPAVARSASLGTPQHISVSELDGPWSVRFQAGRGAPEMIQLSALTSLTDNSDPGVKYFSGIATYTKTFSRPRGLKRGAPLWLDLGRVGDVAEVSVNGKPAGTVWQAPFRVEIGDFVKPGRNTLEIRVADLWVNRLIGDAQPGAHKVTFTIFPTYQADAPLRPSGLMGPVRLLTTTTRHDLP